jgi:ribonuclease HI
VERIQKIQDGHDVRLISRWVKGHREGAGVDVWLNRRVDQMAKKVMADERIRVQTEDV